MRICLIPFISAIFCSLLGALPARSTDAALIEAAKKEGSVTWYTTQIINQFAVPAAVAFERKYGVKVNYVRTDNAGVNLRIWQEAKAGKVQADVFDGAVATKIIREGLVLKWQPDSVKDLPSEYRDPQGYWVATNLYVLTPGINTDLVPKGIEPQTFEDLLDPRWKGRLVWAGRAAPSAAGGFIGAVISTMGEVKGKIFLRQLASQNIAALGVSARVVLDQVIAGEYAIGLNIFNHNTIISAAQGAPTTWLPMNQALAVFSIAAITKDAPHPNATKLMLNFLVSEEGQRIYSEAVYITVHPKVSPRDASLRPDGSRFKATFVQPDNLEERLVEWWKIYEEIFK